jgi:hypothetical protein
VLTPAKPEAAAKRKLFVAPRCREQARSPGRSFFIAGGPTLALGAL